MSNLTETVNLTDELSRQAGLRPEAPAILLPARYVSFRQLEVLTWNTATYLRRSGVNAGDVVGLLFANEPALLVTMLATARIGATNFSIPRSSPPMQQAEMAEHAGVRHVLTDIPGVVVAGLKSVVVDIDALARTTTPIDTDARDANPHAPWLINTGSGSTGLAKLLPVTHGNFLARLAYYDGNRISPGPEDRVASLMHLDFSAPKSQLLLALFRGSSICLFDRARANPLELCRRAGITILYTAVIHLENLIKSAPAGSKNNLPTLRGLVPTGSVVSDDLRKRVVETLTPNLYVFYATNETGGISVACPGELFSFPGTVGRLIGEVQVEIVDPDGARLPAGSTGQIRVRTPWMIHAYLDDPAASERAFRDGWFFPGDLCKFSPDGTLIFLGRADHMMIMDGINIYPAEIEAVLSRHPAVGDVVAVPVLSPEHQEIPVCAVVLRKGEDATERELVDFAYPRMGARYPRRVAILAEIPRTGHGKVMVRELNEQLVERLRSPL